MGDWSVSGIKQSDDTVVISVSEDFSVAPAGRLKTDGPKSGELFRDEYLVPALEKFEYVKVLLDGVEGYGSSFLEESFGGLVRVRGFSKEQLMHSLSFVSDEDPTLCDEIALYVADAQHIAQSA